MTEHPPCAVAIGNFDGVHRAHRELLHATSSAGLLPAVLMFNPHPKCIVAPEKAPLLLTSIEERCAIIREQGIDEIQILPFTPELARLSPEEFATRFLRDQLNARIVVVGENFRFGYKKSGDTTTLEALGFETKILPSVYWRGIAVSASEVRRRIAAGEVSTAGRLLERPYSIAGTVVSGRGVGSKQTVPTLNLETDAQVIPASGVYITRTTDLDQPRRWNSITNIGYRPTFGTSDALTIETFLLQPLEGEPPSRIRIEFLGRVREERKFDSPDALKAQIFRDVSRANNYFRRIARWTRPT